MEFVWVCNTRCALRLNPNDRQNLFQSFGDMCFRLEGPQSHVSIKMCMLIQADASYFHDSYTIRILHWTVQTVPATRISSEGPPLDSRGWTEVLHASGGDPWKTNLYLTSMFGWVVTVNKHQETKPSRVPREYCMTIGIIIVCTRRYSRSWDILDQMRHRCRAIWSSHLYWFHLPQVLEESTSDTCPVWQPWPVHRTCFWLWHQPGAAWAAGVFPKS